MFDFSQLSGSISVRQQGNRLTGYLDMGVIYGTSEEQLASLRERSGKD